MCSRSIARNVPNIGVPTMKISSAAMLLVCALLLQGCITSVVTVPVKVAYGVTKGVVKGTIAVTKAVIPDDDDEDENDKNDGGTANAEPPQ